MKDMGVKPESWTSVGNFGHRGHCKFYLKK
jgi:hypothetical protein